MSQKQAVIIGAGPAGLTAAYELLLHSDVHPVVIEADNIVGGISRTVNYRGNRMDIGGHRFFSKSDRVMQWWLSILPAQRGEEPAPGEDLVMLVRRRLSRIYYDRKFFDYPVTLSALTLRNLGLLRTMAIGFSYIRASLFPIRPERSLEDFLINRFGRKLYLTFFKDYTEKVWGTSCRDISAEWGAQRIKGLSITKAVLHAARQLLRKDQSISQKSAETSLIEQFLDPKFGPGQLWEEVARRVEELGGEIHLQQRVCGLQDRGQSHH